MKAEEIKKEILEKTAEYYRLAHKEKAEAAFVPGVSRVNYAGRVFDENEMVNLVDSSLEFWLTYGHWSKSFEKGLADYLGVRFALRDRIRSRVSAHYLEFHLYELPQPPYRDRWWFHAGVCRS